MTDDVTTISQLKQAVFDLVKAKGWGVDGVQNVQHVAMAMTVEMSELLEKFQWLEKEDVERLQNGLDPERSAKIGEEFADVMMYGLQIMRTLNIDVSREMEKKIDVVLKRPKGLRGREIEKLSEAKGEKAN